MCQRSGVIISLGSVSEPKRSCAHRRVLAIPNAIAMGEMFHVQAYSLL